jgi:hypothetical protein
MDRHPDFGLIGVGLDQSNLPPVQEPESIDASEVVDGELVERPVGSVFTLIRRGALRSRYETDWATCQSVARAGYRYGWAPGVRAHHLGWDDYRLYPRHLASKLRHGPYREVELIGRAPTLAELALAAPAVAATRDAGVPDPAVLELTWRGPAVAAALPGAVAVERPGPGRLPFEDGAAGAVVLVDPPAARAAELVADAARVATHAVIAIAGLPTFAARGAGELAPPGWTGREAPATGDLALALAERAGADAALRDGLGVSTVEDRERWLALFAAAAFGPGERRLWLWRPEGVAAEAPERVRLDPERVRPWQARAVTPRAPRRTLPRRLRDRASREARVAMEVVRIRASRSGAPPRR